MNWEAWLEKRLKTNLPEFSITDAPEELEHHPDTQHALAAVNSIMPEAYTGSRNKAGERYSLKHPAETIFLLHPFSHADRLTQDAALAHELFHLLQKLHGYMNKYPLATEGIPSLVQFALIADHLTREQFAAAADEGDEELQEHTRRSDLTRNYHTYAVVGAQQALLELGGNLNSVHESLQKAPLDKLLDESVYHSIERRIHHQLQRA